MKPKIALFLHQPYCSVQSGNGIISALSNYYTINIFTRHELERDFFDDKSIVAFPGGFGDSETWDYLTKENRSAIKRFIRRGGRYLGICMGAYWAGSNYFNLLDEVDAVQYITRPGTDTRRPHAKNLQVKWQGQDERMYFYDGCALVGNGQFDTVATYSNGDPMAIIQNRIGLIGCHPESEQHWYDCYSWMRPHYHQGRHHQLLLDFVSDLNKT